MNDLDPLRNPPRPASLAERFGFAPPEHPPGPPGPAPPDPAPSPPMIPAGPHGGPAPGAGFDFLRHAARYARRYGRT